MKKLSTIAATAASVLILNGCGGGAPSQNIIQKPSTPIVSTPSPAATPTISPLPTQSPSVQPSASPTPSPTISPKPSSLPSQLPSVNPSAKPPDFLKPTPLPTPQLPSTSPSITPSIEPTAAPNPKHPAGVFYDLDMNWLNDNPSGVSEEVTRLLFNLSHYQKDKVSEVTIFYYPGKFSQEYYFSDSFNGKISNPAEETIKRYEATLAEARLLNENIPKITRVYRPSKAMITALVLDYATVDVNKLCGRGNTESYTFLVNGCIYPTYGTRKTYDENGKIIEQLNTRLGTAVVPIIFEQRWMKTRAYWKYNGQDSLVGGGYHPDLAIAQHEIFWHGINWVIDLTTEMIFDPTGKYQVLANTSYGLKSQFFTDADRKAISLIQSAPSNVTLDSSEMDEKSEPVKQALAVYEMLLDNENQMHAGKKKISTCTTISPGQTMALNASGTEYFKNMVDRENEVKLILEEGNKNFLINQSGHIARINSEWYAIRHANPETYPWGQTDIQVCSLTQ